MEHHYHPCCSDCTCDCYIMDIEPIIELPELVCPDRRDCKTGSYCDQGLPAPFCFDKPIPDDIADQANFWKENLNSGGNADQFITMLNEHRTPTDVEDHVMDMFRDEEDGPFTIQAGDLT